MGRATEVHSRRHLRRSPLLHEEKFLSPADRTLFILFITGAGTPLSGTSRALLLRLARGRSPPRGEGGSPEPPSPLSHERKFPSPTRTPPSSPQGAREALRNFPRPFRTKENFSKSSGPLFFRSSRHSTNFDRAVSLRRGKNLYDVDEVNERINK
jgi:hypothetical protein